VALWQWGAILYETGGANGRVMDGMEVRGESASRRGARGVNALLLNGTDDAIGNAITTAGKTTRKATGSRS